MVGKRAGVRLAVFDIVRHTHPHADQGGLGQFADQLGRAADPQLLRPDRLALGQQRARAQHPVFLHRAAVHDDRAKADEAAVPDRAAMHHRHMADQHIVTDQRRAFGLSRLWTVTMDNAAILNVGPCAYHDAADIGAQHAIVPDARFRPDGDIADDPATGRDEGAVVDLRRLAVDRDYRNVRAVDHLIIFQKET